MKTCIFRGKCQAITITKHPDYQTAARVIGFFFGDEMRNDIISNKKKTIKEFTGVWIFEK